MSKQQSSKQPLIKAAAKVQATPVKKQKDQVKDEPMVIMCRERVFDQMNLPKELCTHSRRNYKVWHYFVAGPEKPRAYFGFRAKRRAGWKPWGLLGATAHASARARARERAQGCCE